jgi:predicted TPR repeat methyltransferase
MPGLFRAVVASHPVVAAGEQLGPVLDLGCGTGLVAVALAGLPVGPLVGVDIAPRMLRAAAAKQLYAELREADVMAVLAQDYEQWKLILAADVLCYFGALEDVFAGMHARLVPGGWLVASTEELLPDADGVVPGDGDWALQRQGRYAHTFDYVRRTALDAGFTLRRLDREAVRHEASAPVAGLLLVLERGP